MKSVKHLGRRLFAVLLAAALWASLGVTALAAPAAPVADEDTALGAAQLLDSSVSVPVDPAVAGIRLPYSGYFTADVAVGSGEGAHNRSYKLYIPEDFEYKTYQVMLNLPEGWGPAQFLLESGWKALADEHSFVLRLLEPDAEGWGANRAEDLAYIASVKSKNANLSTMTYAVGCGAGGGILQRYVLENPASITAAAFLNASAGLGAEDFAAVSALEYEFAKGVPSGYTRDKVPLPVWIADADCASDEVAAVIDYWKRAGGIGDESSDFMGGKLYAQTVESPLTPNGNVNRVAVTPLALGAEVDSALTEAVYEQFLARFVRYGDTTIGSNSLLLRPDHEALGVERRDVSYNNIRRDYLIYVPESVKNADEAAPVVFTLHGNGSGYRMIFETSGWWEVARDEGFILVSPNGRMNATSVKLGNTMGVTFTKDDEGGFFSLMIDDIKQYAAEEGFRIDESRLYLHGQSQGHEGIVALMEGKGAIPEKFAAIGATTRIAYPYKQAVENLPGTFYMAGQYDNTRFSLSAGTAAKPSDLCNFLTSLNVAVEVGEDGNIIPSSASMEGRYTTYRWLDRDGSFAFSTTRVENRGHSMIATDVRKMWEGCSLWSRNDAGVAVHAANAENGVSVQVRGASGAGVNTVGVELNIKALQDLGAVVLGMEYADGMTLKEVVGADWQAGDINLVLNRDIDAGESETVTLIFDAAGAVAAPDVTILVRAAAGQDEHDYAAGAVFSGAGFLCGDANADGRVSAGDLVRLRNYIGMDGEGVTVGHGADVNGDGTVNGVDLTALNRWFATAAL